MIGTDITVHPIYLGLGATATIEPVFTGSMDWYAGYVDRHQSEGAGARLVSMRTFEESWDMWEMHPLGCEVVLCTAGAMTLHQECADGLKRSILLGRGEYAVNGPGT
jgi:hypothetical protein